MYSYFRVRVKYRDLPGTSKLVEADGVAPAMGLIDNLYQNMRFELNGVQCQRLDNNVPQAAAIETRIKKRGAWLDTVGKDTNLWHEKQTDRLQVAIVDPSNFDEHMGTEFELTWRPPMSIMDIEQGLHSSRFRLTLNAINIGSMAAASAEYDLFTLASTIKHSFEVTSMFFYAAIAEGPNVDNSSYSIDLQNLQIQTNTINTTSTTQKDFTVPKTTYMLGVAYQSLLAETDPRLCGTKFTSGLIDASGAVGHDQVKLNDFYIQYSGQQRPRPNADPLLTAETVPTLHDGINFFNQRYYENQLYNGSQFGEGGGERLENWLRERGAYFLFPWLRDGRDESDRVIVRQGFSEAFDGDDGMQILLFAWWRSIVNVTVEAGKASVVVVEDF
jgi:galactitol-specific phosphotransferase system IIB component